MTRRYCFTLAGLAAIALALLWWHFHDSNPAVQKEQQPEFWFEDVTDQVGVDFKHDANITGKFFMPEINGSGVALFDFDGDDRLDIYFLNGGGPDSKSISRLYKNTGDGTFKDVTEGSGLGISGRCTGVAIGDVNNDGWPDVLVGQYGGVKLFLNNGDGTFTDITAEAGLKNPLWATSVSFVDYDRDGWLDLIVVNYVEYDPSWPCEDATGKRSYCGPATFKGTVSKLFRNAGRTGKGLNTRGAAGPVRFEDVTVKSGLAKSPGPGLGVYCADFNGDGWPDIFIANDGEANHLWINQKNGTFTEEGLTRGIAVDSNGMMQANMGVAVGDVDGDGLFDVFVTHLNWERNTLWRQGPRRGEFHDHTARTGLLASHWRSTGFGTVMGDFDQDGWIDIAVANGLITDKSQTPNPALGMLKDYADRNQLFRNEGRGKFRDISDLNNPFCGTPNVARSLACGDLDGDGALDLVMTMVNERARVFRNVARPRGHWLMVRALDPRLKRDAYGAEVQVTSGDRSWLRIVNPADSFQSSSDPRVHFGLGQATRIDAIRVLWPDGLAEIFENENAVDRVLTLRRGEGRAEPERSKLPLKSPGK